MWNTLSKFWPIYKNNKPVVPFLSHSPTAREGTKVGMSHILSSVLQTKFAGQHHLRLTMHLKWGNLTITCDGTLPYKQKAEGVLSHWINTLKNIQGGWIMIPYGKYFFHSTQTQCFSGINYCVLPSGKMRTRFSSHRNYFKILGSSNYLSLSLRRTVFVEDYGGERNIMLWLE